MKESRIKSKVFVFLALTAITISVLEASAFNIQFEAPQIDDQPREFVAVFTDNTGLSWSQALPGRYSNGCVSINANGEESFKRRKCTFETTVDGRRQVKIKDSEAAKACLQIGARLPTQDETERLIRHFDHFDSDTGPKLTPSGIAQMKATFGDDINPSYWSSSVSTVDEFDAYFFNHAGGSGQYSGRNYPFGAVRCVSKPFVGS